MNHNHHEHDTHPSPKPTNRSAQEEKPAVYTCPMHPEVQRNKPGLCPDCGMSLVKSEKLEVGSWKLEKHREHDKHAGHSLSMFAKKFWISLLLTIPVVLYSELPEKFLRLTFPTFPGAAFLPLIFSSIVFFYGGWVFISSAYRELQAKLPGMMTLIALAITAAYFYSAGAVMAGVGHPLFWELTTLITIMLLGHYLEMRAVQSTQGALRELAKLLPEHAEVLRDGQIKLVPLADLHVRDIVLVRPGGKIPADGKVINGEAAVNEAMMTGESQPVKKTAGGKVIAGTISLDGRLEILVGEVGEKTFLAGVMRLVEEAQASKSKLQLLSDRAAFYLTLIAISTGTLTFLVWWLFTPAGVSPALERMVAVLVITCPHALGLAVPLVASISTTLAAQKGFLIRQRLSLEKAREIDTVLFDKTGTLTTGRYGVEKITPSTSNQTPVTRHQLLQLAASVDNHSEHFAAQAIVREAQKERLSLLPVADFTVLPGRGVQGKVAGQTIAIGGISLLEYLQLTLTSALEKEVGEESHRGKTVIYTIREKEILGAIILADIIREESRQAVSDLQRLGVKTAMITGDTEEVAAYVAKELGIDLYFSRVLPQEKSEIVKRVQRGDAESWKLEVGSSRRQRVVAMVGDGINDAPALTQADLGVAIGAGTNVAIESAGIILVRNDPRDIAKIIQLSKATYRKMLQNLFWATGYNLVALPLAAGVLASRGLILQPAFAAVLMSVSTIIVAFNALLLRRTKLD